MAKKPVFAATLSSEMHIEPIQASTVIIIHPGSMYLRMGRASDAFPHVLPHVIARKNRQGSTPVHRDSALVPLVAMAPEVSDSMDEIQNAIGTVLASCLTSEGSLRYSAPVKEVREHNMNVEPKLVKPTSEVSWTSVSESRNILIGNEALHLNSTENYNIHWPIRRGQFNLHPGIGGSMTAILDDLETIWSLVLQQHFNVSSKEIRLYRAVLVIPDVYNHSHVKELVNLLLVRLGFACCFVHLETVCATFGAGLSYACVIDVGDQKTSVSCVEDGISHKSTRITLGYGGSDISQLFYWLQKKCHLPYNFSDSCMLDSLMLHELKETLCHVNLDTCGIQERSFFVKKPDMPTQRFNIKVGDECLIAPLALFHPELFGMTGSKEIRSQQRSQNDPSDPHDEAYLIQTQRRGVRDTNEGQVDHSVVEENHINVNIMDDDIDSADPPASLNVAKDIESDVNNLLCEQLIGIDQAIVNSVECCDCDETKRRMYSCILVVGGGMMFSGIHTWLRNRLLVQIPIMFRGEPVEIITKPKDMDPRITVWKGASVMSCLDTAQELWITRKEWLKHSSKLLRERAPFTW